MIDTPYSGTYFSVSFHNNTILIELNDSGCNLLTTDYIRTLVEDEVRNELSKFRVVISETVAETLMLNKVLDISEFTTDEMLIQINTICKDWINNFKTVLKQSVAENIYAMEIVSKLPTSII